MASQNDYVPVPGSELAPLAGASVVSPADPNETVEVIFFLRGRSSDEALASFVDDVGKQRVRDRQYLSREEFAANHGADPADIVKVERFANENDLAIIAISPPRRSVRVAGSVANLSKALKVELFVYQYPGGTYRGRTGPVHVPAELADIVKGIFGLDNRPQGKPQFRSFADQGGGWLAALGAGYTPVDVARLYNFPQDLNGQGQCIGIIEFGGGYRMSDLNNYFGKLGIPTPNIVAVSVAGASNSPTVPSSADAEVMLDIEVVGSVAPGAQIVVYFAPIQTLGWIYALYTAIHDSFHKPSVISISWGGPEVTWSRQALRALNSVFQSATAMGITICTAAGDTGSSDGIPGRFAFADFPASSPYVLACGGTRLESSGGSISREVVWNDGQSGGATGGGVSAFFGVPSYQTGANVPPSVNPGHRPGRGVPDVAGNADPVTGYQVRVDGTNQIIGGTSAVAPLWAGLTALINQKLGKPVGYLNPQLYNLGDASGAFHDITNGDNGAYTAGPGWDACTGLGSPDGGELANLL